jgi:diphthamide biosynthesis methyltransferase
MPDAVYLARAGQAFVIPVHPGDQPVHPAVATNAQITATNRLFDQELRDFILYQSVTKTIRKQSLEAVNPTFYNVLEDATFGYADVTVLQLLSHIQDKYGTMTRTDLESNQNLLKAAWNPDDEFANLWTKIKSVRQIAVDGGDPILDTTTMELALQALCQAGNVNKIKGSSHLLPIN